MTQIVPSSNVLAMFWRAVGMGGRARHAEAVRRGGEAAAGVERSVPGSSDPVRDTIATRADTRSSAPTSPTRTRRLGTRARRESGASEIG